MIFLAMMKTGRMTHDLEQQLRKSRERLKTLGNPGKILHIPVTLDGTAAQKLSKLRKKMSSFPLIRMKRKTASKKTAQG